MPEFQITSEVDEVFKGLAVHYIHMPAGLAHGRALIVNLNDFEPKIYPFYELINASFNPKWGYCPPSEANLGVNVPQLLARAKPEAKRIPREELSRLVFACNTLHTNFVRSNGFIITDGSLVCKPPGAVALDGRTYVPLGYHPHSNPNNTGHFSYEVLILRPAPPAICTVNINNNLLLDPVTIQLAISGPRLVAVSKNVVSRIPVRPKERGQTVGNEINYDPYTDRTSFTAFGIERETNKLIAVSMFAGRASGRPASRGPDTLDHSPSFFQARQGEGITLAEMAALMIALGASDAIAGGGSGDTQQYVYKQGTWAGQPRHQPTRPQVAGLRGLGAILALLRAR